MKLHLGDTGYDGRAVDLRHSAVDGARVAAGVRGECCFPAVEAPPAPAVYDYCGRVHPAMGLRTRTALAAAGRSLGYETAYDDRLAELRSQLAALSPEEPSRPSARDDVPDQHIAELRETAAETRGRLRAREELDAGTEAVAREVREATSMLAERETERAAARESRQQRREAARDYRDRLARRRRLADRLANRRRDARRALVDRLSPAYADALSAAPCPTPADPFDAPPVPAALAVLRVARTAAPVVLEVDRFRHPSAAARWLDAPVVRC